MKVFRHVGDLGDIIASLPTIRELGGGRLILGNIRGRGAREPMDDERFNAIAPLLRIQPYITSVEHIHDAEGITHDFACFRITPLRPMGHHTLVNWHHDYMGLSHVDLSPWITGITPDRRAPVVFARTLRYWNPWFKWRELIAKYPDAAFIGFKEEHRAFCTMLGGEIPRLSTANLLEVAQVIAGSDLLICNQSCPFWIAIGMGHNIIQETDHQNLNSVILRDNAKYCKGVYP